MKRSRQNDRKIVTATEDRLPDSYHLKYPINYGYIEDITARDGEDQEAYILGITTPVRFSPGMLPPLCTERMMLRKNEV